MAIGDKEKKATYDGDKVASVFTPTGNLDSDLDSIARHYKPADLDDDTWRGIWKGVLSGESGGDMSTRESTYGKLPKGKRAFGPMQVTPATGKGLGFTDEELKDPIYGFMAGVKNLRTEWDEIGKDARVVSPQHRAALTFAAYHAGRGNVIASLDRGEDGVPDVDDGGINTRDYVFDKVGYLGSHLGGARKDTDAPREGEQQDPMTFDLSQPSPTDIKDEIFSGVKGRNLPAWKKPVTNFDELLMEQDRVLREELGLITPENYPHNITSKPVQYQFELQPGEALTPDRIVDALVTQITGDARAHEKFKIGVGHPVLDIFKDEADAWLQRNLAEGTVQVDEVVTPGGARTVVRGATPVQSLIIRQLNAFSKGGKQAVDAENALMQQEIADEERRAAEIKYGKIISDLNNQADEAERKYLEGLTTEERDKIQPEDMMNDLSPEARRLRTEAGVVQSELEKRFPTTRTEEIWKGIKRMTAGVATSYRGLVRNIKEIGEAVLYTNDKEYIKEGARRDKQYREAINSLQKATPETRRLIGGLVETVGSAVAFDAPVYMAGGAILGPSGIIYTTALRSADKPIDEFARDIATAVLEIPVSKALGGLITKGGYQFGKQELGETLLARVATGGLGEATPDAALDYLEGKKFDWKKAIHNLAAGGGFGVTEGAKSKEGEQAPAPTGEMFQVMSPVGVAIGKDGNNRYQAVIKVGENIGLVEIPPEHPIIVKYAAQAEAGGVPFIAFKEDQFDQALQDFKGTGKAALPKLTVEQTKQYLEGLQGARNEVKQSESDELLPGTQREQVEEVKVGETKEEEIQQGEVIEQPVSSGNAEVLVEEPAQVQAEQPKTFRKYRSKNFPGVDHAIDADLAVQWDAAKKEYDDAYRAATQVGSEVKPGIMIRAGHEFSRVRTDILKEQQRRDAAKTKPEGKKQTTTPGEKPFEAGKMIKVGSTEIRLPDDLARRWQNVQDDYKAVYQQIRDDKDLSLLEKQRKTKEINSQRIAEQQRIVNEYRARETETTKRGYIKDSDRPLKILEDKGDELVVQVSGEDATRVMSRDQVETRKERVLKRKGKTKLPLIVRAKSAFGAFAEGKQASYASDGVVYINDTTQSKIEDALGQAIDSGFTFKKESLPGVVQKLRDAGLKKVADQLEAQEKANKEVPVLVNANRETAGLTLSHERVHQKASDKDLPRSIVEKLFTNGGSIDKLFQETTHDIKNLNPYDSIQEILAYGLTGDYEALGVEPDFLYDALLDVVEGYMSAYPNADLDTIFDNALIDIDSIKNEAARRIKYGSESKQPSRKESVQTTGREAEGGKEKRSEATPEKEVRERTKLGFKYGESHVLNEVWKMSQDNASIKNGSPVSLADLRAKLPDLDKKKFDKAVEDLARSGDIFIHKHDAANLMPEEDRNNLVEIDGEYFVALTVPQSTSIGFKRSSVSEDYDSVRDIQNKPVEDITKSDVKTVVEAGKFGVLSGGAKTAKLKNELDRMGFKVLDAEGSYKSGKKTKTEPSLFVICTSAGDEAQLIRLAIRFNQSNLVLGNNGTYRAPFTANMEETFSPESKAVFGKEAEKQSGNTVVKTENGELAFSVPDLDLDTRGRDEKEQREVEAMTRAYEKSFENPAKITTADLTRFLQEQMNLGKRKKRTNKELATFLEETVRKMYGEYPNPGMKQAEYDAIRSRRGVKDLLAILEYEFEHTKKTAEETGMTWYKSSIEKMHQRTGQAFPEVLNIPQMRILFELTLALSSPANKVNSNYKYTVKLWQRMLNEFELGMEGTDGRIYPFQQKEMVRDEETGEMRPKKYGKFGPLLDKFNNLSKGYVPVESKDVEKVRASGAEMKQSEDYAGISGATQWYAKDPDLERLIKKYGHIGGVFEYLLTPGKTANNRFRVTEVLGPKVGAFFFNIAGFSQLVTVDSWISRWFYMLNGGLLSTDPESKSGMQDDPKSDHDGDIIRGIMQAASKEWNKLHPELKLAPEDVQAMAWYHIKNILFLAGGKDSGLTDFHAASEKVLTEKDIVADIDGSAAERQKVIDRFKADTPALGPRAKVAGTAAAEREARDFHMQQMANGARSGLAHTKRKDVVNKKLANFDSVEWSKFSERAKGEPLSPQENIELNNLLQKGYQAVTDKERIKVKEDLISFANNLSAQPLAEFLLTVRKAGMLSGVKTTGRNVISNFAFGVLEEMQRGVAAPIDVTIALSTGRERTVQGWSPTGIFKAAFGKEGAFREGLVKFKDTMVKGNDAVSFEDVNYDPKLRPFLKVFGKKIPFATGAWFLNATIGNFAKYIFRFQKAQDVFFRTYAYNRAMYEIAALKEKNQGIPIVDTLANPSFEESDAAQRVAEVMVFQNENTLNTAYQRFKSKQPAPVKYLLDYKLPFIKTGSNIFARTMDYLGIGGAYKVGKLFKDMDPEQFDTFKKKAWEAIDNPEARKVIIGAFSRGLVGLGTATIGWYLAAAGLLNGMDDDDQKERAKRIAQGSGPGHLKIGDKWRDIRGVSPVATILLSGASAYRAFSKDLKDESKRYDAMLAVASSIVVDGLPLARAVQDFTNPKSGRSVVQSFIGAESVIPAIIAEYAAHRDDAQRVTQGESLGESIKRSVQARIPGKREKLPEKTDVFGRSLEQPSGFNPFSTKKAKDDKVLKEASVVGWSMTPPKRNTKEGETEKDFLERKKKTQELVYKLFDKVVNDSGYSSDFTKPERKEILDEAAGIARRTISQQGKLTDREMKNIVDAVLEKAKVEAKIEKDPKMSKEDKKRMKQRVSTRYSDFIGGPTRD